jgi:hypothetical protein
MALMPKTPETIHVRGPRSVIEELHAELAARQDAGVRAARRRQNLLSRHPCRHDVLP